jgi:hypothetical protein
LKPATDCNDDNNNLTRRHPSHNSQLFNKQNKKMSAAPEKALMTMALAKNRGDARAAFTTCLCDYSHLHTGLLLGTIRLLIKEYPQVVRDGGIHHNYLALHETCAFACPLDIVKVVYNAYPDAIKKRESLAGMTCLHLGCGSAGQLNLEVIEFLLKIYPDARNVEGLSRSRPFHMLCNRRHGDQTLSGVIMDAFLLKYPELLVTGPGVPLYRLKAHGKGRESVTNFLRDKIIRYARALYASGEHAKYEELFAANCWDAAVIKLYMQEWPEFKHYVFGNGRSPLHVAFGNLACFHGLEGAQCLLDASKDVVTKRDDFGQTPLHRLLARERKRSELKMLPKAVHILCGVSKTPLEMQCLQGRTPLHAANYNHKGLSCHLRLGLISPNVCMLQDSLGNTPLHALLVSYAKLPPTSNRVTHLKDVIQQNVAALHIPNNTGLTPLLLACTSDAPLDFVYSIFRCDPAASMHSAHCSHQQSTNAIGF